jgi:peptidoglycan/LPS O-acetylase OafA/YrhL
MEKPIHFPGLNGLRALAALAVIFSHTTIHLNDFGLNNFIFGVNLDGNPKTTGLAGFGVSIFFTLSGFLITYLLLEENRVHTINLKNFYIRRILRIWPLYYLYLGVSLITIYIFKLEFNVASTSFYVFMAANIPFILSWASPLISHYWSLGVEEQFYAFWPLILKKISSKYIFPAILLLTLGLILLKTIFRIVDIKYNIHLPYKILHATRFHCMLIGATAAVFHFRKNPIFFKITSGYPIQLIAWFIILLVTINEFHVASFIDNELISLVTIVLIAGQINVKNRVVNMDNGLLNFTGKISYGLYVTHPIVIFYLSKIIDFTANVTIGNYLLVYGCVFSLTFLIAYLSYTFYEKPFLRLKERYTTIKSTANKY